MSVDIAGAAVVLFVFVWRGGRGGGGHAMAAGVGLRSVGVALPFPPTRITARGVAPHT